MNKSTAKIDLSTLPEDAQRELVDFYQFLKKRYKIQKKKAASALPGEFLVPIAVKEYYKVERNEIYADV